MYKNLECKYLHVYSLRGYNIRSSSRNPYREGFPKWSFLWSANNISTGISFQVATRRWWFNKPLPRRCRQILCTPPGRIARGARPRHCFHGFGSTKNNLKKVAAQNNAAMFDSPEILSPRAWNFVGVGLHPSPPFWYQVSAVWERITGKKKVSPAHF